MFSKTPSDTVFIRKLTEITEANLSNEKFGVKELAKELGLSHSQIYRKLHSITKQSASQFIRELRLEKAKEMLQQELFTVAEIAYKVGFSSPSYFNKCYHNYFGHPPGDFRNHITNKNIVSEIKQESEIYRQTISGIKAIPSKKFTVVFGILVLLLFSFFSYKYLTDRAKSTVKSIAVLPLRNLSNDPANQHLADGIMNDILSRLSQIHDFEVKSSISATACNKPDISIHEIAKNLGVSYVIEGSVFRTEEKIRLYVQLIDAENDSPIWSAHYDNDLNNIFAFITEVSNQIADELEAVLSIEESEFHDKKYTENEEAYKLYMGGRFYYRIRTEQSFEISIEYYNKALALDSNYCLAYAGLADTYLTGSWYNYYPKEEGIQKSRDFALKALSIDNDLAEAHTTLGAIATYFSYNFEMAEKELKLALKINPRYVRANKIYSEYLIVIGKHNEAHKFLNIALEYSPSYHNLIFLAYRYSFSEGNYDKALVESNKLFSLDNRMETHAWRNFEIYLRQGEDAKAFNEIRRLLIAESSKIEFDVIYDLYITSGMKSVVGFIIENDLVTKDRGKTDYKIARLYAFIGKNKQALNYLEKEFDVRIKYEYDFKGLRTEPRFLALLEKMNLGGY